MIRFDSRFQHTAARRRLDADMRGSATEPMFQHTAARRRLAPVVPLPPLPPVFQHTAARRRLGQKQEMQVFDIEVSTHSRPKAAGRFETEFRAGDIVSTHSRPKAAGGSRNK